jgi:cystathionine beta-synthase
MWAALEVAEEMDAGANVVVILPDTGRNYLSKLYSDTWMLQHGYAERPVPARIEEILTHKDTEIPPIVTIVAGETLRQAVATLQKYDISQAPVTHDDSGEVASLVGSIRERSLLDRIYRDPEALQLTVAEAMDPPLPLVGAPDPLDVAFERLQTGPAVVVEKDGKVLGVLTRSDLLEFLAEGKTR